VIKNPLKIKKKVTAIPPLLKNENDFKLNNPLLLLICSAW